MEAFLTNIATLAKDAVLSQAWMYPLLGISYLVLHPELYSAVAPVLIRALTISIVITAAMFFFTYVPQLAFCALFSGPLAFATATAMVLGESYVVILFISKAFFLNQARDKLFDAVLVQQGHETLVQRGRQIKSNPAGFKVLGKSLIKPLDQFSVEGLVRYIISLPLNSVPAIGTIFFLFFNGIKTGPAFHSRYYQLKNYDRPTRLALIESRKGAYAAFGTVALGLSLVPFIGLFFTLTSTIGAALWVSKLERSQGPLHGNEAESIDEISFETGSET